MALLDYASDNEHWTIDARRWPVVVVTGHAGMMQDDVVKSSLKHAAEILRAREGTFAMVHDGRSTMAVPPQQRRMFAEAQRDPIYQRCRGNAFVLDSVLMHGVMQAIYWMQRQPAPHRVFSQLEPAVAWARISCGAAPRPSNHRES